MLNVKQLVAVAAGWAKLTGALSVQQQQQQQQQRKKRGEHVRPKILNLIITTFMRA